MTSVDANQRLLAFRIASRELFNSYFRIELPYENDGWTSADHFREVEQALFRALVLLPCGLDGAYKEKNSSLRVKLRGGDRAPALINRDIDSGYWDYPVTELTSKAKLAFVDFFDWDALDCRENHYVRVVIDGEETHPEIAGKFALLEFRLVKFELASIEPSNTT